LVQELTAATKEEEKQSAIARLMEEVEVFKTAAQAPEWLPAWKVASALEAMLKQLAGKPHSLNPSTLRTTAAAVDLIHTLSQPGIRPDLVTEPPVRVLAVDDDRISRHAISFTLKQTLNLPELADNGVTGLKLATQNAYDAIFLDVQMPDLNGFELCARIRETELNGQTPVVFVTCHNDFSARAKSTAAGGQDLIGKPFLTFEMGLKALTLVLQRRLNKTEAPEQEVAEAEPVELAAAVQ
jgi:CheY-like chemotaxis protein